MTNQISINFQFVIHGNLKYISMILGMRFWKYEGLGNDFVLWRREETLRESSQIPVLFSDPLPSQSLSVCDLTPSLIQNICNRHTGVGADGIILILSDASQSTPNYRIKIFNSDGSCAIMCGNGVRCVIKLISDREDQHRRDSQSQHKEDDVKRSYEVMTDAGMVMAQVNSLIPHLL
jgi:diaminopimelate epimerase